MAKDAAIELATPKPRLCRIPIIGWTNKAVNSHNESISVYTCSRRQKWDYAGTETQTGAAVESEGGTLYYRDALSAAEWCR